MSAPTALGEDAQLLLDEYRGDLRRLREEADGKVPRIRKLLQKTPRLGPVGQWMRAKRLGNDGAQAEVARGDGGVLARGSLAVVVARDHDVAALCPQFGGPARIVLRDRGEGELGQLRHVRPMGQRAGAGSEEMFGPLTNGSRSACARGRGGTSIEVLTDAQRSTGRAG